MMRTRLNKDIALWMLGLWLAFFAASSSLAELTSDCGTLYSRGQYGPYDYRNQRDKLPIVEGAHFTDYIEALIKGNRVKYPGADIDYTLRAIPNHHRALLAMMRLGEKEKTAQPREVRYTIDCWFKRAIEFRPDDSIVRMIYSTYLRKNYRSSEAESQLYTATSYAKENAFTHYNIGMHYFDLKIYDKALIQAHRAMTLGLPQTELRDQLRNIGKWADPVESPIPVMLEPGPIEEKK